MTIKTIYRKGAHLSDRKIRKIVYYFALQSLPPEVAKKEKLNVKTVIDWYKYIRTAISWGNNQKLDNKANFLLNKINNLSWSDIKDNQILCGRILLNCSCINFVEYDKDSQNVTMVKSCYFPRNKPPTQWLEGIYFNQCSLEMFGEETEEDKNGNQIKKFKKLHGIRKKSFDLYLQEAIFRFNINRHKKDIKKEILQRLIEFNLESSGYTIK